MQQEIPYIYIQIFRKMEKTWHEIFVHAQLSLLQIFPETK